MSARDLLRQVGEALYGPQWQSPLARDLDVAVRSVQRWAAGDRAVSPAMWPRLYRLLSARAIEIEWLRRHLADEFGADLDTALNDAASSDASRPCSSGASSKA